MLYSNRNNRFSSVKSMAWGLVLLAGVSSSTLLVFTGQSQAQEVREEYFPVVTFPPYYPKRAVDNDVEGWVQVEFTVDEQGGVKDASVVDHCASINRDGCTFSFDAESRPITTNNEGMEEYSGVFNESSLAAVSRFRFNPRHEGDQAVETPGVQYVFSYRLDE